MNEEQLLDDLYDYIDGLLNRGSPPSPIPIERLDENQPRPEEPYVGYRIATYVDDNNVVTTDINGGTCEREIIKVYDTTVTIEAFRTNARQNLVNLSTLFDTEIATRLAQESGFCFVFIEVLAINNTSIPVDTKIEERATMDILIRVSDVVVENVEIEFGLIESVEVQTTFDGSPSEPINRTLNIDTTP